VWTETIVRQQVRDLEAEKEAMLQTFLSLQKWWDRGRVVIETKPIEFRHRTLEGNRLISEATQEVRMRVGTVREAGGLREVLARLVKLKGYDL
jgi:hypothetical protein